MIEEIIKAISEHGTSVVLLAWLIYKDYKFNQQVLDVLDGIKVVLAKLETWHSAEDANADA